MASSVGIQIGWVFLAVMPWEASFPTWLLVCACQTVKAVAGDLIPLYKARRFRASVFTVSLDAMLYLRKCLCELRVADMVVLCKSFFSVIHSSKCHAFVKWQNVVCLRFSWNCFMNLIRGVCSFDRLWRFVSLIVHGLCCGMTTHVSWAQGK